MTITGTATNTDSRCVIGDHTYDFNPTISTATTTSAGIITFPTTSAISGNFRVTGAVGTETFMTSYQSYEIFDCNSFVTIGPSVPSSITLSGGSTFGSGTSGYIKFDFTAATSDSRCSVSSLSYTFTDLPSAAIHWLTGGSSRWQATMAVDDGSAKWQS